MKTKVRYVMIGILLCVLVSGCGGSKKDTSSTDDPKTTASQISQQGGTENKTVSQESETQLQTDEQAEEADSEDVVKINTYVTEMAAIEGVTCPTFAFEYPDNWKIMTKEYNSERQDIWEEVILQNLNNARIIYMAHRPLGNYGSVMMRGVIEKVADSQFVPSYPAGSSMDCSDLAPFAVAQVRLTGTLSIGLEDDYHDVKKSDDYLVYAVVPEKMMGGFEDVQGDAGLYDLLSFEYPSYYLFVAEPPDGGWSETEREEAIAILSSFRVNEG